MNEEHNKFMEVELLLGGLFTLGVDGICFLIDWTGVGLAIAPIVQGFTTFTMWMWSKSKGDPGALKVGRQIAKYASNMLPLLPTNFIAFAVEAYLHNHPKVGALTQKLGGLAGGKPASITSAADIAKTRRAMNIPEPIG